MWDSKVETKLSLNFWNRCAHSKSNWTFLRLTWAGVEFCIFPMLHKCISSPAQVSDVMTDFIKRLKENFASWLDGLALPGEVMGFARDLFTVATEGNLSTRAKEVVPSTDEGQFILKLDDEQRYSSFALTGLQSFGLMSEHTSSLMLRK